MNKEPRKCCCEKCGCPLVWLGLGRIFHKCPPCHQPRKCKYCGEPVVAPHGLDYHLACASADVASKECELDTKDIVHHPGKEEFVKALETRLEENPVCTCKLIRGTDGKWRTEFGPCHSQEPQPVEEREVTIEGVGTFTVSSLWEGLPDLLKECDYTFRSGRTIEKLKEYVWSILSSDRERVRKELLEEATRGAYRGSVIGRVAEALDEGMDEIRKAERERVRAAIENEPYPNTTEGEMYRRIILSLLTTPQQ